MLNDLISHLLQNKIITSIINISPLIWAIYQYRKENIKPFFQKRNQIIFKQIIIPFYESIELHLFEEITEQNRQKVLVKLTIFIDYLRKHQLFFYLNSNLTHSLLNIEYHVILNDNWSLEEFNKEYRYFSTAYFQLSWKFRKYSGIEKNEYFYRKQLNILTASDKAFYLMYPTQVGQFLALTTFFVFYFTMLFYRFFPIEHLLTQACFAIILLGLITTAYCLYILFLFLYKPIQKCSNFIKGVIKPH